MKKIFFLIFLVSIALLTIVSSQANAADCSFDGNITTYLSQYDTSTLCDNQNGVNVFLKICAKTQDITDLRSTIFLTTGVTLKNSNLAQGPADLTTSNCNTFQWNILCASGSDTSQMTFDITYTNSSGSTKSCSLNYETELNTNYECTQDSDCSDNWYDTTHCEGTDLWGYHQDGICSSGTCGYATAQYQLYESNSATCTGGTPSGECNVSNDCGTYTIKTCVGDDLNETAYRHSCIDNSCARTTNDEIVSTKKTHCDYGCVDYGEKDYCKSETTNNNDNNGGSSGTGGGSYIIPSNVLLNFTDENPISRWVNKYDKYCFDYKNMTYCFKVKDFNRINLDYIIDVIHLEGNMTLRQREDINLDKDPMPDLYVWYDEYDAKNDAAKLTFKLAFVPVVKKEDNNNNQSEKPSFLEGVFNAFSGKDKEGTSNKGNVNLGTGLFISAIIIIAGLLVYFIFSKKKY